MMPPGFALLEYGNGRPQIMMATRGMGMPMDIDDMQVMAAHRHRILIAESSAQRMEMEGHMQAIRAQTCPPGFRPPLVHPELPPNIFPPGPKVPSAFNEAMLPQGCPPGFRPPVQNVESAGIMQPETITYPPEFRFDDQPGDPAGMHDTIRGSSMHGAGDRHGWYPNESSSGAGRALESHPQRSGPYEIEAEHVRSLYRGAELESKEWQLPNNQLLSSVTAPNGTQPMAYNPEAFWPGNTLGDSLAGTGERRIFEGPDNSPRTPPFKRQRTGHEVESSAPPWARSRLESEIAWSNGLRMSDDRSRDHHNDKQAEHRKKYESSNGTLDRWHDRQELRTRRSPLHYQRGSVSPGRNRAPIRLEVSQKSEFLGRSFRAVSQSDISSRASSRPVFSDGNEKQHRKCPGLIQHSRSPTRRSYFDRRSFGSGERSWQRDCWLPRSPAGKSSSGADIDPWRTAEAPGKVGRNMDENGFHSSRVFEARSNDDRGRIDSQLLNSVMKENSGRTGEAYNSLENVAPAFTDGIKNEKSLSLIGKGTVQKLPETKFKTERCETLGRMPSFKNGSTEKARSGSLKHGEYQPASPKPISTSLKITRYFIDDRSAPKYIASKDSEVDWKTSVEKAAPWRRRTVFVSAEEEDEAEEGEILHIENRLEASRLHLERNSITSETETTEGGLINPFVAPPIVFPEAIVYSSSLVHGGESQVTIGSKVGSNGNEKAGQKWISTGSRSKHIPNLQFVQAATGSDSQSPDSLGKSHTPGASVLTEDAPCFQQMEEGSPTSTVRNGRVSVIAGVKRLPDNHSVPSSELVSLVKEQVICAAGEPRSDVDSLRNPVSMSETENPKPSFVVEKRFLQESTMQRQNVERDPPVSSGQLRYSCNSHEGDVNVKPFVRVSGSLIDDWLSGITSSIPLATEGLKSNGSTSESLQVPVKYELQHSSTSEGEKQREQPSAVVRDRTTSVQEAAKVVLDMKKPAMMQGKQNTKVIPQPSALQNASALAGDKLARQRKREGTRQGDLTRKVASFLADAGSPLVTDMSKVMSIVSQRPGLQELRNPGGDSRAVQMGKVSLIGSGLAANLNQDTTGEGKVTLSDSEDDFEVITEPSRGFVTHFDRELGKRRRIMHPEEGGHLKQVLSAANIKKVDVPEQNSGAENLKGNLKLIKKHVPILKGGIERTSPVMKMKPVLPPSSHLSVPPAQTLPSRTVGRSYMSNKTWRREVTPVNSQQLSNTPPKPAVIAQPSTYIRKKFSIVRNPASQVPQSNVGAQSNIFPRFSRGLVTPPRNKTYSLSASKSKQQVNPTVANTAASASASPRAKSSNTKTTELLAMPSAKPSPSPVTAKPSPSPVTAKPSPSPVTAKPSPSPVTVKPSPSPLTVEPSPAPVSAKPSPSPVSAKPSPSPVSAKPSPSQATAKPSPSPVTAKPSPSLVKRLQALGDESSATQSESFMAESLPVSRISPSKPSRREGSSGLTTLASHPVSKSLGGATTDETIGYVVSGSRLYRKRKFDQVHVGLSTSALPNLKPGSKKCDVPQGYIKKKRNQLVRCDHPGASAKGAFHNLVEDGDQMKFLNKQRRYSSQLKTKTKLGRVLSHKKGSLLGLARVWTLNNEVKQTSTALGISRDWRYPLFPWKRSAVVAPRLRRGRSLHEGKMGALFFHISNQLQKYRTAHPVYTRSADGFSLHRSGVVSKSGANLKWTKSLKTRSILASEAATKVVAEAEKKKRDKKEAVVTSVAKARGERRTKLRSGSVNPSSVSSVRPLGIGGSVYVRKGFGNQLVRNLKTVARAVASEKFRWSLRNARLRRAKKQSYCLFYTRFGVCKRGDGKCLYIHDPEKVAVCTKFLRGSCSDPACRLTHKVIPERMSDCSYFLEGLCTNESCPYRHVNVNKEAPVCEAFLQGYCADGDKCTKKHTYVCPEFTLTGSCSSSNCKLRHPKKATKESADPEKEASKGLKRELQKGRYFTLTAPAEEDHQGQPIATANKIALSGDDLVDFISIDEYGSESSKECQETGSL